MENVDFHPRGALFLEISKEKARVACRVACVLHVCCMCVACALHEQGHTNHIPELGKWDNRGRHKNFAWQARDFGS